MRPFDREGAVLIGDVQLMRAESNQSPVEGLTGIAELDGLSSGAGIESPPPQIVDRPHTQADPGHRQGEAICLRAVSDSYHGEPHPFSWQAHVGVRLVCDHSGRPLSRPNEVDVSRAETLISRSELQALTRPFVDTCPHLGWRKATRSECPSRVAQRSERL